MAVKKTTGRAPRRAKKNTTPRARQSVSQLALPKAKREADTELLNYITMVYGRAGVGKTTFLASYPELILMSCERVSRGLSLYDFNWENGGVTSWKIFLRGLDLLEKTDHEFRAVGVDTIDALYQMCLTHVCALHGCKYPPHNDFGKVWGAIRSEFRETLLRVPRMGLGLVLTSHCRESTIVAPSGEEHTRIEPSCSGQAYDIAKSITDVTIYMDWMRTLRGKDVRVMITEGDEIIDAKNSVGLPRFMELPKEGGYSDLEKSMRGADLGIESKLLMPSRKTSQTAGEMLKSAKATDRKKKKPVTTKTSARTRAAKRARKV